MAGWVDANAFFAAARQELRIAKTASFTTVAAQISSSLDVAGNPGAGSLTLGNTTTGLVPTSATAGFPTINPFGVGATGKLLKAVYKSSVAGGAALYDRVWHAGSINLNALATTTFSAPPAISQRLPGGNDYSNLDIFLEINAAASATATTVAVGYANSAAVAGRTTGATASLSGFINKRLVQLPWQAGDKGVLEVDSLTVGGTVATAGSVNVILARRLARFDVRVVNGMDAQGWDLLGAPEVYQDSALWVISQPDSTASGVWTLDMTIAND